MKRIQAVTLAISLFQCTTLLAVDGDAVLGGAIGGGVGAAIGSEIGGREGAIVGGGVGAAVGTAIATDGRKHDADNGSSEKHRYGNEREHGYRRPTPRHYHARPRIPRGHMPPPGLCRYWYPGRPPGHQPPPGDCRALEYHGPTGRAWLVRG